MNCMNITKLLARAETSLLYTRFLLNNAKEGKSKPASADVAAGIFTAAGILGVRSTFMSFDARMASFHAVSRSCEPISKEIKKLKKITKKEAEELLPRVDRVVNKLEALWTEVQNNACREDAMKQKNEETVERKKFNKMAKKSLRQYHSSQKRAKK